MEALEKGKICSTLTIKTPENVNNVVLVFLLLTSNIFHTFFIVSIVDYEQTCT